MEITTKNYNIYLNDDDSLLIEIDAIKAKLEELMSKLSSNQNIFSDHQFENISIEVTVVDSETIKDINSEHRDKNKPTDVLSFPAQNSIRQGEFEVLNNELVLGDIVICHEICLDQAKQHSISYMDEFIHLFVHSIVHLYGYDHEVSSEEEFIMEKIEKQVLDLISSNPNL